MPAHLERLIPFIITAATTALSGCAATALQQAAAADVVLTRNAPGDECVFVGEVRGSQGNFWTAEFTSDENQ